MISVYIYYGGGGILLKEILPYSTLIVQEGLYVTACYKNSKEHMYIITHCDYYDIVLPINSLEYRN